jgi:hypothetical protein
VDTHAKDVVGINGIARVLLVYTCQQGVHPRGHVLPLRLPTISITSQNCRVYIDFKPAAVQVSKAYMLAVVN